MVFSGTMTSRDRLMAAMRGEPTDRYPVWLKSVGRYWREAQPGRFDNVDGTTLQELSGCDVMTSNGAEIVSERPRVTITTQMTDTEWVWHCETPDGPLHRVDRLDAESGSGHPSEYAIKTLDDVRRMRWVYEDTKHWLDESTVADAREKQAEWELTGRASTMAGMSSTPFLEMMQELAGPERTIYMLHDDPKPVEELFAALHADRMRELDAMLACPAYDSFWVTENTSTTLFSPAMFEQYCMGPLADYANAINAAGVISVYHMCGKLSALLGMIETLPVNVIEAYTTHPVGNVTIAQGRTEMPSKCLIGGTNAALWLRPAEEIIAEVAADIAACPDRRRVVLTSAGVLPKAVGFDKAKQVVEAFKRL
jgi:uroporphyrinogen-III decarboxylase